MTFHVMKETTSMQETPTITLRSGWSFCGLVAMVLLMVLTGGAGSARAEFGLQDFSATFLNASGTPFTQAAGHPDVAIGFHINQTLDSQGKSVEDGQMRTIITDLPKGFYGNPQAVPQCSAVNLSPLGGFVGCPPDTLIGTFGIDFEGQYLTRPLFNVTPGFGQAAAFGANILGATIGLVSTVTEEHGAPVIRTTVSNASQGLHLNGTKVVLWGVPADPSHNAQREELFGGGLSGLSPQPFLTMPSDCTQPMVTHLSLASWQNPTNFIEATDEEPAPTGCESLELKHTVSVAPIETRANTPSGFDIGLNVPQSDAADGVGTPPLRRVQVDFPAGVALSPTAADGLAGCSDAQLHLGSDAKPECPDASRVGSVTVDTPLLAKDLTSSVYVGTSTSDAMFRVFLALEGPGVLLKIPGKIEPDPTTGQLKAVFDQLPELPFSAMQMHLKGGPNAVFSTPNCGTYTTTSELTAWSGQVSRNSATTTINQDCDQAGKFEPSLTAGLTNPVAGGPTAFSLRLTRPSGQQAISTLGVSLPPGVLAKVGSVPLCPEAQAAAGTCSAASKIGTTTVGAGDGSSPTFVPQPGKAPTAVYLAGPYKGAPYSLSVVVPAQAGPYDLGTVVVRSALRVDPTTAQVTVQSDPLPTILKGVPVRVQDIRVDIDRPGFVVTPTNCKAMRVTSTVTSAQGLVAHPSSRFQVASCGELGFKPKLALSLAGGTKRSKHPALKAVLTTRAGEANISSAAVTLPKSEFLENAHIKTVCTRVQYVAKACPANSIYGYAKAWSPLLDQPLKGPVYLRSSSHKLPDLVASLDGPIHIDLAGRIDSVDARIRNTFDLVPDAPVSKFVLEMQGGKKGLLVNNRNLCKSANRAKAIFDGQNGKVANTDPVVQVACGKRGK
jgi:hypothetical protein